nr:hypothetical protein [Desulfobacterales bacterium]
MNEPRFILCLISLGISSVSTQLIMIREAMSIFGGNEMIIGVALGLWLLFSGIGSLIGIPISRWTKTHKLLSCGHILVGLLPFAQLSALRALPFLWPRGQMPGMDVVLAGCATILLPYCLVAGAMIPIAGCLLGKENTTRNVYIADTIGDIAGGLFFSLLFVYFLSHWQTLIILAVINLVSALVLGTRLSRRLITALMILILCSTPLGKKTLSWRFPDQEIMLHKNTPFGQITLTSTKEQINVFQDGIPLYSTGNLDAEALVHIPLCQVKNPSNVLLIAGGVFGTLEELSKYHPERIDYVELDPAIVELDLLIHHSLKRSNIHTHLSDGRLFVKKRVEEVEEGIRGSPNGGKIKYDVVIVDLPDPENAQLNRFYTEEFFSEVKNILKHTGVLFFTLSGSPNYYRGEEGLALNRSVYRAVKKSFKKIIVFPGDTYYYLVSNKDLNADISGELAQKGIKTRWLVDYQLPDLINPWRMEQVNNLLSQGGVQSNRDLSPIAFGYLLNLWAKKSGSSRGAINAIMILALLFAVATFRGDRLKFVIFSSGYTAMALELSLLLLFQVVFGYAYLRICGFVTLFMIGSAAGAFISPFWRQTYGRQVMICDKALAVTGILTLITSLVGIRLHVGIALLLLEYGIIPGLIIFTALAAGCQFAAVSRLTRGTGAEITGRLYLSDLAGASCGTLFSGLILLPKTGIGGIIASVLFIKGASILFTYKNR